MKFKNMKRFATAAMAGALALSMSAPAFAASTPNTTTITGNYNAIKLAVTVPTTGKAVINPYGLPYKLGEATISGQQITTGAALIIQNKSEVALKVDAEVYGTGTTGVTLEDENSSTTFDTEATKKLQVLFEVFEAEGINADTVAETATVNAKFAALDSANAKMKAYVMPKSGTPEAGRTATVDGTAGGAAPNFILREGSADGTLQNYGAAFFRLSGQAAKKATWATTDGFTATIAFTFTPDNFTKPAGTLTTSKQAINVTSDTDKTATATLALALPDKVTPKKVEWTLNKGDTVAKIVDASTLTAGSVVIKGTLTGVGDPGGSGSTVKITVTVTGSDGIKYTASTNTSNDVVISA